MKNSIFALVLIAIIGQVGMVWPEEEMAMEESQLSDLPGISTASFIFVPGITTVSDALQKLQPPQVADQNVNADLKKIDEVFKLLFRKFDRPTLDRAKQAVEDLKPKGDAIRKYPRVKEYFANLISIARQKLLEAHENKETGEKLDTALGAFFALDPVISIFAVGGVQGPLQGQRLQQQLQDPSKGTPVTPPPLFPTSSESGVATGTPVGTPPPPVSPRRLGQGLPEWLRDPAGFLRRRPVGTGTLSPATSSPATSSFTPLRSGYKGLLGRKSGVPIKPNIPTGSNVP